MGLASILGDVAAASVSAVEVRSHLTPPLAWTPAGAPSPGPEGAKGGGGGSKLSPLAFVRPSVRVTLADGTPVVVEPYGAPLPGVWLLSLAGVAFLGWVAIEGVRRGFRRLTR